MSPKPCPRIWEVEAVEDGRLQGESRAAFERHLDGCSECRSEARDLRHIRDLARSIPSPRPAELERRRQRSLLLRRANEQSLRGSGPRARWVLLPALAAIALVVVLAVRGRRTAPSAPPAPSVAMLAAPTYEVVDAGEGHWTVRQVAPTTVVAQESGRASFHVEHLLQGQRFLVTLPDGELEVRGTRFVISIVDHRTRDVSVSEGVVALRLTGDHERLLAAGDHWSVAPTPAPTVVATAAPVVATTPLSAGVLKKTAASASGSVEAASGKPKVSFTGAMASYQAGNFAEADGLFARFLEESPGDARCEDALFLRAVIHARLGDRAGAGKLLEAYLARYPNGLRREEAERFAKTLAK